MSALVGLLCASIATFFGAFVAGHLAIKALYQPSNQSGLDGMGLDSPNRHGSLLIQNGSKFSIVSSFGAGIAIGAALGIVIPEGLSLVGTGNSGPVLTLGFATMVLVNWLAPSHDHEHGHNKLDYDEHDSLNNLKENNNLNEENLNDLPAMISDDTQMFEKNDDQYEKVPLEILRNQSPRRPKIAVDEGSSTSNRKDKNINNLESNSNQSKSTNTPSDSTIVIPDLSIVKLDSTEDLDKKVIQANREKNALSATIGLIIHSMADGIAMGATAAAIGITGGNGVIPDTGKHVHQRSDNNAAHGHDHLGIETAGLAVYIAMIIHKMPASFALGSFLVNSCVPIPTIRRRIFMFSIATPIMAIFTYYVVSILTGLANAIGNDQNEPKDSQFTFVGNLVLFSGGSFLHAATMHMLPQVLNSSQNSKFDIPFSIVGMIIPPLILSSLGH